MLWYGEWNNVFLKCKIYDEYCDGVSYTLMCVGVKQRVKMTFEGTYYHSRVYES